LSVPRNPTPLTLEQPLDIEDARRASRRLAELRRGAEQYHELLTEQAAEAEREYRKEYAKAYVKSEGTVAEREALARADTADLAYTRDLKAGMVKVQSERLRGLEGERSMLKSLIDWSQRLDPFAQEQREMKRAA
jgi:hypothetical protein